MRLTPTAAALPEINIGLRASQWKGIFSVVESDCRLRFATE